MKIQVEGLAFNSVLPQVMDQLGYFKDENLNTTITVASNPGTAIAGLVSNATNLFLGGSDALIAIAKGAPVEFIAGGANGSIFSIITSKNITSLSQLKGKTFAISSPTSISTVTVKNALKAQGFGSKDIKFVVAGTSNNRYKALVAGQVQAASLSPGLIQKAVAAGYHNLGNTDKLGAPPIITDITTVNKNWAAAHQDAIVRYLRAMQRLTNDLYDTSKWNTLAPIFAKIINVPESTILDIFKTQFGSGGNGTLPRDMSIAVKDIQNTLDAYKAEGTVTKDVDVASTVDNKYLQLAKACS